MNDPLEPSAEIGLDVPGYYASAIGGGAWVVKTGEGRGPIVVLDSSLNEIHRITPPSGRELRNGEPFATASLASMKAAWLSWPDLYLCDLGEPLERVAVIGEGDSFEGSDCSFTADGQALYFVAPKNSNEAQGLRLFEFDVGTAQLEDLGPIPAPEGRVHVQLLPSGGIFVAVEMSQNGGLTFRKSAGSNAIDEFRSSHWMFDVSDDEGFALGGCGDVTLFGWPSARVYGTAKVPGTVIDACFLDDTNVVAFTAGDGAAFVSLDTFDAGPLRPFGDGDDTWCLAHQDGIALSKIGSIGLATFDLAQLRQ
jgi:hypothetical protein